MIQRIFAVCIFGLMVVGGLNLSYPAALADDSNWSDDTVRATDYANKDDSTKTIEITNAKELGLLAYEVNSGNTYEGYTITLKNDIDLSGHNWDPIGHHTESYIISDTKVFKGTFDGRGYTISNMNINVSNVTDNNHSFGFFGGVLNGCVKNLNFENCNIEIVFFSSSSLSVGTVAGFFAGSEVSNISVNNSSVTANADGGVSAGGLCGNLYNSYNSINQSNVKNISVSKITLSAVSDDFKRRGGIIGFVNEYSAKIMNCYANNITFMEDAVQDAKDCSGGVIGYGNGGTKEYCYCEQGDIIGVNGPYPGTVENSSKVTDGKLETPVTIDGKAYDTLIDAMNAWVEKSRGDLIKWKCDDLGLEHELEAFYIDETYHKLTCKNCSYTVHEEHKTTLENKQDATCTAEGYSGDEVCSVCKEVIKKGSVIEKTDHNYVDGKCRVCGTIDPDYNQNSFNQGTSDKIASSEGNSNEHSQNMDIPPTADSSDMTIWVVILIVCLIVMGGSIVSMKKKKS